MYQLKMIEDPSANRKWVFIDDGKEHSRYLGAVSWSCFCRNKMPILYAYTKDKLIQLTLRVKELGKEKRDIIRPLNIEEYNILNKVLKDSKAKYNKKKGVLIWETLE